VTEVGMKNYQSSVCSLKMLKMLRSQHVMLAHTSLCPTFEGSNLKRIVRIYLVIVFLGALVQCKWSK